MPILLRRCSLLLIAVHSALCCLHAQPFQVDTVARAPAAQYPVSLAFAPPTEGKLFFTEKISGRVRVIDKDGLRPSPFVTVAVESEGEQGLLGVAVHPLYPDSPYVYITYTDHATRSTTLARYRDSAGTGKDPAVLLSIPRTDGLSVNNGGSIRFGPDGKLYVSVGDHGSHFDDAQDVDSWDNHYGKILRLNSDGSVPQDNPFPGKPTWSYGHRNVLGFDVDPLTGVIYCTDDGPRYPNTVNRVPRGANLGWPEEQEGTEHTLYVFSGSEQPGLTGIVMYRGSAFPRLRGALLFGGHADPVLRKATLAGDGTLLVVDTLFRTNAGFADIEVGPDGSIYLANGPYVSSRILRLLPVAPSIISAPPVRAVEDSPYVYTPECRGTPPEIILMNGPEGMVVDTTTQTLRWMPSSLQAVAGMHMVTLRASNGAGHADQSYVISVENILDPPGEFGLIAPEGDRMFETGMGETECLFRWEVSEDPDLDTVSYLLELDTVGTFDSGFLQTHHAGRSDSLRLVLPQRAGRYYWRVTATDGERLQVSRPEYRALHIRGLADPLLPPKEEPEQVSLLKQNYPNPFNPSTSITYRVLHQGPVRLSVFNLLGQEVALIFDGTLPPGEYVQEFVSADLPTGIYFYRIQAPGYFDTKKMVVAR